MRFMGQHDPTDYRGVKTKKEKEHQNPRLNSASPNCLCFREYPRISPAFGEGSEMMGDASKDLLQLERKNPSSSIESTLTICKNDSLSQSKKPQHDQKPITTTPAPTSQVLGKVKDFLGVISEANKRLQVDAKDKSSKEYDIEALTGNESEYIEMDLMLGIADLHTPEAVAAAESAIAGYQPEIALAASSSGTESEDSSDDDDDDDSDSDDDDSDIDGDVNDKTCSSVKLKRSKSREDNPSSALGNHESKKRPKIVELP